jgi:hypothetical protein
MPSIPSSTLLHSSWSALSPRRRMRLMILLPFLDDPYAKLLALREVCKSKENYLTIQRIPNSPEVIVDLFRHDLQWISQKPTDFTFKLIHSKGWTFSAPDARFSDFTMEELVEMEIRFNEYLRLQRESALDKLMDVIYTPQAESSKTDRLTAISALPYPYRLDAFRMFAVIHEKIHTSFKHLFPNTKVLSEKDKSKPIDFRKIPKTSDWWTSLLFSLAETPAFQGMETAKEANMWEALTYLDEKAFEAKKAQEARQNNKH